MLTSIQQELDSILKHTNANSLSFSVKCSIRDFERKKIELLKQEESFWGLSRATWLQESDKNTKFFHKFASARRDKSSIWKKKNENGESFVSQKDITREAINYFRKQYNRRSDVAFQDILWGIEQVPQMFNEDGNEMLFKPVTKEELFWVLKTFKKDKSPGSDGWTIEFLTHFFELIKHDHLRMAEASRMSGNIYHITSSTLIALIPKKLESKSFNDFRPISLCNISFKIIAKIFVERIKGNLASFLTKDQYTFLKDRNILDVVAITQECLSSMYVQKHRATIMKIDLRKTFDSLDWGFMECLIAKISRNIRNIRWIMACIQNVNYVVIVNGIPSHFFKAERGLRQGCPVSPLLFILAMNSLSIHINKVVDEGRCKPIKICRHNFASHNLFVDDVLLFEMLHRSSWICQKNILDKFQRASGLTINKEKSMLYHNNVDIGTV